MDNIPSLSASNSSSWSASPSLITSTSHWPQSTAGAVIIHAGAGFHSRQNEQLHVDILRKACEVAMERLRAGEPATKVVEAAIVFLEDVPSINAGKGSNLNEDGIVECDASVVDHLGRSGGCGAVPGVKNPISLALEVLEISKSMEMRWRLPPNFLVGEGARRFAQQRGLTVCSNTSLLTSSSRNRWAVWRKELECERNFHVAAPLMVNDEPSRDHAGAVVMGTWNEGQPDSPIKVGLINEEESCAVQFGQEIKGENCLPQPGCTSIGQTQSTISNLSLPKKRAAGLATTIATNDATKHTCRKKKSTQISLQVEDAIQDTVGAIAIDLYGDMAAGSSSGGVGMKLSGRVGPAALVGMGTAVLPVDCNGNSIAAVCSGTGEHFSTTMAAQASAQTFRDREDDEDTAIQKFIQSTFLGHPSVATSSLPASIGVLIVKQRKRDGGYYVHWGHNSHSFAVAAYSTEDKCPTGLISRLSQNDRRSQSIAIGAKKLPGFATKKAC